MRQLVVMDKLQANQPERKIAALHRRAIVARAQVGRPMPAADKGVKS